VNSEKVIIFTKPVEAPLTGRKKKGTKGLKGLSLERVVERKERQR